MAYKINFTDSDDIKMMADLAMDLWPAEAVYSFNEMMEFYKAHPYMIMAARDENDYLMGYIGLVPLRDKEFNMLLEGTFVEKDDFTIECCIPLEECSGKTVNCYVPSIVTRNQNTDVAAMLLFAMIKYVRKYKELGIKIRLIAAEAYSKEGANICEKLGFECVEVQKPLSNGFRPRVYILDLLKENSSFLISKVQRILYPELFK